MGQDRILCVGGEMPGLIVDLRDVLDEYNDNRSLQLLYSYIPLKHIVDIILRASTHGDEQLEYALILTGSIYDIDEWPFSLDDLEELYDDLEKDLFKCIYRTGYWSFVYETILDKWIDSTSVLFHLE